MRYQPQGRARISRSPLAKGLVFSAVPGLGDVVGGAKPAFFGSAGSAVKKNGKAYTSSSTSTDAIAITPNKEFYAKITRDFTIAFNIEVTAIAVFCNYFSIPYRGGATWSAPFNALAVYANGADADKTTVQWAVNSSAAESATFSSNLIGSGGRFIVTRSGQTVSIYKNGNLLQSVSATGNSNIDFTNQRPVVMMNASESSLPNAGCSGWMEGANIWNRALPSSEAKAYDNAQNSVFEDAEEYDDLSTAVVYVGTAGGAATVTGVSGSVASSSSNATVTGVSGRIAIASGASTVQGLSGSIASASGAASASALSGSVGSSQGSSISTAVSGRVAVYSSVSTVQGVAGSLGSASGSAVVNGFAFAGGTGTATGGAIVTGVAGHIGSAQGSGTATAYAEGGSTGTVVGAATATAVSGKVASAAGSSTAQAYRGYVASASGSSTASAVSISLYLAQASGSSNVLGVLGRVGIAIGSSFSEAIPLPTGIRPIEPTYNPLPIDFSYTVEPIDSDYNVLTIESGYYGNPT